MNCDSGLQEFFILKNSFLMIFFSLRPIQEIFHFLAFFAVFLPFYRLFRQFWITNSLTSAPKCPQTLLLTFKTWQKSPNLLHPGLSFPQFPVPPDSPLTSKNTPYHPKTQFKKAPRSFPTDPTSIETLFTLNLALLTRQNWRKHPN